MPIYIQRAKTIVANVKSKDAVEPDNAFLLRLAAAFVYQYRAEWVEFISSAANLVTDVAVVNPSNADDLLDIGTYVDDVWTAVSTGEKNKLQAAFYLRQVRVLHRNVLRNYAEKHTAVTADDAGKTTPELQSQWRAEAISEADTELGLPDNDPED